MLTQEDLKNIKDLVEDVVEIKLKKSFAEFHKEMNQRFEEINHKFEDINQRFEGVNHKFEEINQRFIDINRRFRDQNEYIDRCFQNQAELIKQTYLPIKKFEEYKQNIKTAFGIVSDKPIDK